MDRLLAKFQAKGASRSELSAVDFNGPVTAHTYDDMRHFRA
jgi:hypothetical protein